MLLLQICAPGSIFIYQNNMAINEFIKLLIFKIDQNVCFLFHNLKFTPIVIIIKIKLKRGNGPTDSPKIYITGHW